MKTWTLFLVAVLAVAPLAKAQPATPWTWRAPSGITGGNKLPAGTTDPIALIDDGFRAGAQPSFDEAWGASTCASFSPVS